MIASRPPWIGRTAARRRGATLTEAIVAAVVLVAGLATLAPLAVSQSRLALEARHERMALDALSNEVSRLTALDPAEVPPALRALAPPAWLQAALPEASLEGELIDDGEGRRIALHARWPTGAAGAQRVRTLTGWLLSPPAPAADAAEDPTSAALSSAPAASATPALAADAADAQETP